MPELIGNVQFTGTLDNLTMYKMRGSDKIIVRKKGGPSKKQIKYSPKFDLTRRNNREFGGRARMAQRVRRALHPLLFLADHNITGPLNALFKHIQDLDTANEWGKRSILLSRYPQLLMGYNLNNRFLFDSIVRSPLMYSVSKENLEATVHIPALVPGINFAPAGAHPWYRITAVFGIVPDLIFMPLYGYRPEGSMDHFSPEFKHSDWLQVSTGSAAIDLHLKITDVPKTPGYSCLLAVGVSMGNMQQGVSGIRYVGGAKVLAVQ